MKRKGMPQRKEKRIHPRSLSAGRTEDYIKAYFDVNKHLVRFVPLTYVVGGKEVMA